MVTDEYEGVGRADLVHELKAIKEALKVARDEKAMLRGEIDRLKKLIEGGQAAHNEERVARDWLARDRDRIREGVRYALHEFESFTRDERAGITDESELRRLIFALRELATPERSTDTGGDGRKGCR